MDEVSLDANVILRWFLQDIPTQFDAAQRLIESDAKLHVADIALSEVVYVMERVVRLDRDLIAEFIRGLMGQGNIICNRILLIRVLDRYVRWPAVSFNDLCLAAYAELNNATPLYTFDKAFAKKQSPVVQELT